MDRTRLLVLTTFMTACASTRGVDSEAVRRGADPEPPPPIARTSAELLDATVVTDRLVILRFRDGEATFPTLGHGTDGRVESYPLDTEVAENPRAYRIETSDPDLHGKNPARVGRKSKGRDFVNRNWKFQWVTEHELLLELAQPMKPGASYRFHVGSLSRGKRSLDVTFDPKRTRSEAVHANQVGYDPRAPQKYAYVSYFAGTLGPLSFDSLGRRRFDVIDTATQESVLSGKPKLRKRLSGPPDTLRPEPPQNFVGADLWELDFSSLERPGTYVVSVEGLGTSYPFAVRGGVLREPFVAVARTLYHQRCGTALTKPYTVHERPLCHHPSIRPMKQTSHRAQDETFSDGKADAEKAFTGEERQVFGGWHDAGDWDREGNHIAAAETLLLAYDLAPQNFADGELNLPESNNGLPDLVDEARWGIDYYVRLQRTHGGVSMGFYESSNPKEGEASFTDSLGWYLYAEDPLTSYRHAAAAARLAHVLEGLRQPKLAQPYRASALAAWKYAEQPDKGQRPSEQTQRQLRDARLHAAAGLYRLTGERRFEDAFKRDIVPKALTESMTVWQGWDHSWAFYTYVMTDRPEMDSGLKNRVREAVLRHADDLVKSSEMRGLRIAHDPYKYFSYGSAAYLYTLPLIVAHRLSGEARYLAVLYSDIDVKLGANPLNMSWISGIGHRFPTQVFHPDSWYSSAGLPPGYMPYGSHHYVPVKDKHGWDTGFTLATLHPDPQSWPAYELYVENRYNFSMNEFQIHDYAVAAAVLGYAAGSHEK